jgi:hypothetical protein
MTTTTHTMVVELSHEVVVSFMRWLFREATTSFSLLAISPPHHQKFYVALHGTTYGTADVYQCTSLRELPNFRNANLKWQFFCLSVCLPNSRLTIMVKVLDYQSGSIFFA